MARRKPRRGGACPRPRQNIVAAAGAGRDEPVPYGLPRRTAETRRGGACPRPRQMLSLPRERDGTSPSPTDCPVARRKPVWAGLVPARAGRCRCHGNGTGQARPLRRTGGGGSRHLAGDFAERNLGRPRSGRVWWAHQDSNLGPMDSRSPGVSAGRGLSHHPRRRVVVVGRVRDAHACYQGHSARYPNTEPVPR